MMSDEKRAKILRLTDRIREQFEEIQDSLTVARNKFSELENAIEEEDE